MTEDPVNKVTLSQAEELFPGWIENSWSNHMKSHSPTNTQNDTLPNTVRKRVRKYLNIFYRVLED